MRTANGGGPARRAGVLALALLLAACGDRGGGGTKAKDAPKDGGAGTPERGGTAVMAELSDVSEPMPLVFTSVIDSDVVDMMYMQLTRPVWRDGRLVHLLSDESPMALAWRHEYATPDSTALRFRMRSGIKWSDGRPLTAADVVWTYAMHKEPALASARAESVAQIDSVKAENDSTVVFFFRRRYPDMLFDAGLPIAPKHQFEAAGPGGIRTHPALSRLETLVVSGPFRIGSRRPGERTTLVPNPEFRPRPYLDAIVIRVIPETTTRLVEIRNGSVDMARPIPFDQADELRRAVPGIQIGREARRYWEYLAYNPKRHPAFADPRVRRALSLALDVPGIIRALQMGEFVTPAWGPYPPIFAVYDEARMRPLAQDTAQARRLLDEAGWRDTDGDGVREKGGRKLAFTLLTNAGNQRRADVSQIVQQQWAAVGVRAELRQLEFGTFNAALFEKDFEAVLGSWAVELKTDLSTGFGAESPFNIVSYDDTTTERLFAEARAQPTAERADPLWVAAAERIVQSQPYTWLYYYDNTSAIRPRLKAVKVDTYGSFQNAWEWWIPKSEQGRGGAAAAPAPPAAGADTAKR